jgi:hypothetical protein
MPFKSQRLKSLKYGLTKKKINILKILNIEISIA